MRLPSSHLVAVTALLFVATLTLAQDGGISGPTTNTQAAGYSCDPTKCVLPKCHCASTSPPGGLSPSEVPQFIVFSADDAIQSYTIDSVNQFLAQRRNPNGCPVKMTYFTSLSYTNYSLVTDWYVAGNEIADHTMTHVGAPPASEINGNLIALNALAGIPLSAITGFRAPFLNYTADTLRLLAAVKFAYDSSAVSSIPVTADGTDAYWPYTLDHGLANNCLAVPGTCHGQPRIPGFWEIPMYAFFDERGASGPHLMDPWLDPANGDLQVNDTATFEYMKHTFTDHYNGNRQPVGIYMHPIHLAQDYPGEYVSQSTIDMINAFLDWAQVQQDVWIVSNQQLLAWMQNPVPASQLNALNALKCPTPQVPPSANICNGMPQNEQGLLQLCPFQDFPFSTCYGCPQQAPTPQTPNPAQQIPAGGQARFRLPNHCTTPFWDPIAGKCGCTSSKCQFIDNARAIGPNGQNLTGGGVGNFTGSAGYVPFSAAPGLGVGMNWAWAAMAAAVAGWAF